MHPTVFRTQLVPGRETTYETNHRRVPDALADELRAAGVREWRIWRDGVDVFHSMDVSDREHMRVVMRRSAVGIDWQRSLSDLLDRSTPSHDLRLLWSLNDQLGMRG